MTTLVQARVAKYLSQDELANEAKVSAVTISNMENGYGCRKDTFLAVCKALEVDPGAIQGVNLRRRVGKIGWTGVRRIDPNTGLPKEKICEPES